MIHGGCCGFPGNTRLQVSFIKYNMIENFRELGHFNSHICKAKGVYDPPKVEYKQMEEMSGVELLQKIDKYPSIIKAKYFRGGYMFPPMQA